MQERFILPPFEELPTGEHVPYLRSTFYTDLLIDVDSCLTGIEGIDELGRMHGVTDKIADLTRLAMEGEVPLEDVFCQRLDAIQPTRSNLAQVGQMYVERMTPDAAQAIRILRNRGVNLHLISGGYDTAIHPLALQLGIPIGNVYANTLFFDENGDYIGFDRQKPFWQRNGKKNAIRDLKKAGLVGYKIAIIGDGVSELETRPETDFCIGFGGHIKRPRVLTESDVYLPYETFAPLPVLLLDKFNLECILDYCPSDRDFLRRGFRSILDINFNQRARYLKDDILSTRERFPTEAFTDNHPVLIEYDDA